MGNTFKSKVTEEIVEAEQLDETRSIPTGTSELFGAKGDWVISFASGNKIVLKEKEFHIEYAAFAGKVVLVDPGHIPVEEPIRTDPHFEPVNAHEKVAPKVEPEPPTSPYPQHYEKVAPKVEPEPKVIPVPVPAPKVAPAPVPTPKHIDKFGHPLKK